MRRFIFAVFVPALLLSLVMPSQAQWPPPVDDTWCYPWDGDNTWCNLHDPCQVFWRAYNDDYNRSVEVTVGGTTYHIKVWIYDVYESYPPYDPKSICTSGTPARYWDNWECDTNTDYYFQNHDTCEGEYNKAFRYCWPVAGCIGVTSADGSHSSQFAQLVDVYLDTVDYMLRPSNNPPLNPSPGSRVVYAIRPYPAICSCP